MVKILEQMSMRKRRQQKRFIKRCEIEFVLDGITYRGISSDFSLNGLFIRTSYPVVPDMIFDVIVHLPDDLTSKLKVNTRRVGKTPSGKVIGIPVKAIKNGMGVEIIEKDANYLHFFRSLLA